MWRRSGRLLGLVASDRAREHDRQRVNRRLELMRRCGKGGGIRRSRSWSRRRSSRGLLLPSSTVWVVKFLTRVSAVWWSRAINTIGCNCIIKRVKCSKSARNVKRYCWNDFQSSRDSNRNFLSTWESSLLVCRQLGGIYPAKWFFVGGTSNDSWDRFTSWRNRESEIAFA